MMKITGLAAAVVLALGSGAALAEVPLSVQLVPVQYDKGSDPLLRWSITNHGKKPVQVLRWETPLQGVSTALFEVSLEGRPVEYAERIVHWGHPEARDFIEIQPGQTLSADVDVGDYYAMTAGGAYTVEYAGDLTYLLEGDVSRGEHLEDLGEVSLAADPVTLPSRGRSAEFYASLGRIDGPIDYATRALGYASCSSSRQTSILNAHNSAKTYASNSLAYLNAGSTGPRYTTWFGSYSATRYSTVKSHYSKINNVLQNLNTVYSCACDPAYASAFAYVYPSQPYKIYLCNAFWAAPNTGTDSRAGTIIHEQSHFNANGGTDDHVYGQTSAKSLARSNPNKAVDNADNHEYFSENTPAQN